MADNIDNIETIETIETTDLSPSTSDKVLPIEERSHVVSSTNKDRELEAEDEDEADVQIKGTIIRGKEFNPTPHEIDLYGNIQLHHSVSHNAPDVDRVKTLLSEFPNGAKQQNQFGRIPLHYVLDRADASLAVTKLLLKQYPMGARVEDNDGYTPYDLALHWHHSKRILRLLLKSDRYQDIEMWRRLEYGYLYNICYCFCCWSRNPRSGVNEGGENGTEANDDTSENLLQS